MPYNKGKELFESLANHLNQVEKLLNEKEGHAASAEVLGDDPLQVDTATLSITCRGVKSSSLTAKELQIISLLNSAPRKTLSRQRLIDNIWPTVKVSAKTLDVHIFNLRKKLAPLGIEITYAALTGFKIEFVERGLFSKLRMASDAGSQST